MEDVHWQPPTVASTIRTYAARSLIGNGTSRLRVALWGLVFLLLILTLPSVDSYPYNPGGLVLGLIVGSANSSWREYQFGGPRRIVIAAGLTSLLAYGLEIAVVLALSIMFGPEAGSSPAEVLLKSLPPINAASLLVALLVLLLIRYWRVRPALEKQRAMFRAQAEAERAARSAVFSQ